ncbi:hypothetical protein ABB02_01518 [Clostridiaceae bacterium JG1575]|nr:hypothetical protein ABB02_01518 [Clostridiaceae bacterium JG1575]
MIKEYILSALIFADAPLSEQDLADALGIDRRSVRKRIQSLKTLGFRIDGTPSQGYLFLDAPDSLCELFLRARLAKAPHLHVLPSLSSTNEWVKRYWRSLRHGTFLFAQEQTKGRGRYGRSFYSPRNEGLYLSLLLKKPPLPSPFALTLASAVAVCRVLEALNLHPSIKWVNDIFLNGKKFGGILTEGELLGRCNTYSHLILGIGLNINTSDFPSELDGIATSLLQETQRCFSLNLFAVILVEELLHMLNELSSFSSFSPQDSLPPALLNSYRSRLFGVGSSILYGPFESAQPTKGTLLGITDQGALRIQTAHGVKTLQSGEIRWRPLSTSAIKDN